MDNGMWLAILKWSLKESDGTMPSQFSTMSDEDKQFLEKAFKDCVKDEPARMQEIMRTAVQHLDNSTVCEHSAELEALLEELEEIVEQIDMAQVFVKFGGLECLMQLLERSEHDSSLRCSATAAIGTMAQNNLFVQTEVLEKQFTLRLVEQFVDSLGKPELQSKLLFAISSSVRGFPAGESQFVDKFSSQVLSVLFQSPQDLPTGLLRRGIYFVSALLDSDSSSLSRFQRIVPFLVPSCLPLIMHPDYEIRQAVLVMLTIIASGGSVGVQWGREQIVQRDSELRSLLTRQQEWIECVMNERMAVMGNISRKHDVGENREVLEEFSYELDTLTQEKQEISSFVALLTSPPPRGRGGATASQSRQETTSNDVGSVEEDTHAPPLLLK